MPIIQYLPDGKEIEIEEGETILQAAVRTGIALAHICGGNGRCSTCRVIILQGLENCAPRNPKEQAIAEQLHFDPTIRLACQATVTGRVKLRRLVLDDEDVELSSLFISGVSPGLTGVEKHVLILFADIVGFTSFAESLLPYDVIHVLNRYFRRVGEVIIRHGGHIDTYMGDGFMALFEADDPVDAALRAIRTGLEMIEAVRKLGPYLKELYQESFDIRIGLHYGQVVAGTLGAPGNKTMTVIGDAVNLASRIEAANKRVGTQFLISADAYALVKEHVRLGQRTRLTLPGKSGKYTLYEIIGLKENAATK
jgi:adenylate cyclase